MQYIKDISTKYASYLSKYSDDIHAADKLAYLIERMVYNSIFIIAVLLISIKLDIETSAVTFIVVFILIRQRFGGVHVKNHMACLLLSIAMPILIGLLSMSLEITTVAVIIVYFAALLICFLCGVVDSPIKPLSSRKKHIFMAQGFVIMAIIGVFHYLTYKTSVISNSITLAILICSISILGGHKFNKYLE